jgi:hypothetical protein
MERETPHFYPDVTASHPLERVLPHFTPVRVSWGTGFRDEMSFATLKKVPFSFILRSQNWNTESFFEVEKL